MNIHLSDRAAFKLTCILHAEKSDKPLAIRVVPLTSGCHSASLALEITDLTPRFQTKEVKSVLFAWKPDEAGWLNGLEIDVNRETGKLELFHPHPPASLSCPLDETHK